MRRIEAKYRSPLLTSGPSGPLGPALRGKKLAGCDVLTTLGARRPLVNLSGSTCIICPLDCGRHPVL